MTTQFAHSAAHIAIAGLTLAAPVLAEDEALRVRPEIGQIDCALPAAVGAHKTADPVQNYVTELQDAYARIDVRQNPALAALAANLAQLADRAATR